MRLYGNTFGPGPRRVGLYLAMNGIHDVEFIRMPAYGERSPEFLARNPGGKIPVLELDDGACLFESQAIVQYLEETMPHLSAPLDEHVQQKVDVLSHLINEFFHYFYVAAYHGSPVAAGLFAQAPEADAIARPLARARLEQIAEIAGESRFLAAETPTIADFMLYALVEYIRMRFAVFLPPHLVNLIAWYERFQVLPGMYPNGWQDDETYWSDKP